MTKKKADAVVLAAGLSSRLPEFKPLLKIGKETLIEKVIKSLQNVCTKIIVVCGYRADEIMILLNKHSKVQVVINKNYSGGMFSSLQEGIKYVKSGYFLIIPGDMPFVKEETYKILLEKVDEIVIPVFKGKKGHPVFINSKFIPELLKEKKNSNLSKFIKKRSFGLLEVNDKGVLVDIDTKEDLKNFSN
jgi:molybdenum cofactor cytidylyltransferase